MSALSHTAKRVSAALTLVFLGGWINSGVASAHPGHGAVRGTDLPSQAVHYTTEPIHVIGLAIVVALVAVAITWCRTRVADQAIR
ncbi:MAG: hypothetical protein AAGA03_19860 [Planctomycetota bacterium]